jgi:excisionase family DNA binding protein
MNKINVSEKEYLSISETAELLGYSRQHVLRLVNSGKIKAKKAGRAFVIKQDDLPGLFSDLNSLEKKEVNRSVEKVFKYYEEALKKLGKE